MLQMDFPNTVVPTALGTALDINLSNASLVFVTVTFATMVSHFYKTNFFSCIVLRLLICVIPEEIYSSNFAPQFFYSITIISLTVLFWTACCVLDLNCRN